MTQSNQSEKEKRYRAEGDTTTGMWCVIDTTTGYSIADCYADDDDEKRAKQIAAFFNSPADQERERLVERLNAAVVERSEQLQQMTTEPSIAILDDHLIDLYKDLHSYMTGDGNEK